MKRIFFLAGAIVLMLAPGLVAQTSEELMQQKEAKSAELSKLQADLDALTGQVNGLKSEIAGITEKLTPYPRWEKGLLGNIGLNLSGFNNWLSKAQPNTSAANIGTTLNGFANAD